MKPTEWNATMAGAGSYPIVADEARAYLAACDGQISTTDLVNALYPPQHGDSDEGMKARRKLFAAVQHMAGGVLSDCASRGPEKKVMGRIGRAWLWHAPRAAASRDTSELVRAILKAVDDLFKADNGEITIFAGMDDDALDALFEAHHRLAAATGYAR